MVFATILLCLGLPTLVTARISSTGGAHLRLRNGKANAPRCPGLGSPCGGYGLCDAATGVCSCIYGRGGTDCSQSVPAIYELTFVRDPERQDMLGTYDRVPMYLQDPPGDPAQTKYITYDPLSKGWAVSKLNSSCRDDICFFSDATDQPFPPPKGYVFGDSHDGKDKHFYYRQLVFDDHDLYPDRVAGYHMNVAYTEDPSLGGLNADLNQLSGKYLVQPRFVHSKTGKYAIMPVTLQAPNKTWVFLELVGIGHERQWRIVAEVKDPSMNRYTVPKGPWFPRELGLTLKPSCRDFITLDTCFALRDSCEETAIDRLWVRSCCRQTCGTCIIPESDCKLPHTAKEIMFLQQKLNRTSL